MGRLMLTIGQRIPKFSVKAYHLGKIRNVSSADFRGKWLVLVFYPGDFTFICPTELEELADSYGRFTSLGAEILSISRDDVLDHERWHEFSAGISKIRYPMGSDLEGRVYDLFGIYSKDKMESARATYIFDSKGILRAVETHDNRVGRSAPEILRMLTAAIYVQMHTGELCPASWEPGRPTINLKTGILEMPRNATKKGHKPR